MRVVSECKLIVACSVCLFIGWLAGNCGTPCLLAELRPQKEESIAFPMVDRIGANVYLQTSGEYQACCLGIYKSAELRLKNLLDEVSPKPEKPAVVMDLDETVLDNSAFQTFLYKNNLEYTDELWAEYEEGYPQDVNVVPGARQFIHRAEELGVAVVGISNRSEQYRKSTEKALNRLGLSTLTGANRLYLKPADVKSNDKSSRRDAVAGRYNVLMYFGDNLRDFAESFAAKKVNPDAPTEEYLQAIKQRQDLVDQAACHWGVDWFAIPNPVYGEWEKLIGPDPQAIFRPTSMKKHSMAAASK